MSIRKEFRDTLTVHPSFAGVRCAWVAHFLALLLCLGVHPCRPDCIGVACGPVGFDVESILHWSSGLRGHRRVLGNGAHSQVLFPGTPLCCPQDLLRVPMRRCGAIWIALNVAAVREGLCQMHAILLGGVAEFEITDCCVVWMRSGWTCRSWCGLRAIECFVSARAVWHDFRRLIGVRSFDPPRGFDRASSAA